MKVIIFILVTIFSITCFGQEITIPEYRTDKESFKKIKDKVLRKELAIFTIEGSNETKPAIKLKQIPVIKSGKTYSIFQKDSIKVIITTSTFNKSEHKLKYVDKYIVKIDNKPFWGTDGGLPNEIIKSVQIIIGTDTISIPKSKLNDLYNPSLCSVNNRCHAFIYISNDRKRLYIDMMNSDGAGAYEVTWIIQDKKYLRRVIGYGF